MAKGRRSGTRGTSPASAARPADGPACRLRIADRPGVEIPGTPELARAAMAWTYTLGNRTRWNDSVRREELRARAEDQLRRLGATDADIRALADARVVEVQIPYTDEQSNWAARVMPWEYVLTAATRLYRAHPLTVVRHLDRQHAPPPPPPNCASALLIAAAPGLPEDLRDAAAQRRFLERSLFRRTPDAIRALNDPSLDELRAAVAEQQPSVVHLAGVDTYAGAERLGRILLDPTMPDEERGSRRPGSTTRRTSPATRRTSRATASAGDDPATASATTATARPGGDAIAWFSASPDDPEAPLPTMEGSGAAAGGRRDGLLLVDRVGQPLAVPAHTLASILTSAAIPPSLVVSTVPRSAARTAALTVAEGARLALGVQDSLPRAFADRFVAEFYDAWIESDYDGLAAFEIAWRNSHDGTTNLTGTGIVLWSAESLIDGAAGVAPVADRSRDLVRSISERRQVSAPIFPTTTDARAALIRPESIVPLPRLNYALLHNRQPMFERFDLVHLGEGTVHDVLVEVELMAGPERLPWRSCISVGPTPVSLHDRIFVPLTSRLVRSLAEQVQASLSVRISVHGVGCIHDESYRVTLLPVAEWADTDQDRHWLPSFVYPMDTAVRRIIDAAAPYLEAIADDPNAGFDGYQSIDPEAEDPTGRVDAQVAAIWSAILHETPVGYINPPPVYTNASQRLRTPSETIDGRHGTCLDLALLFASCLEYIDVYPVLFLMEGHAFPGWWRSDEDWERFFGMDYVGELDTEALEGFVGAAGRSSVPGWIVPATRYADVRDQIAEGRLVPIESVWATLNGGFGEAMDEGWENMLSAHEFDCLVDIAAARQSSMPVTPLPRGT